jgi:hypothetical protein
MNHLRALVIVVLVACATVGSASADDNTIPRYFEFKFGRDLLWISASEAITATGSLRPDIHQLEDLKSRFAEWRKNIVRDGRTPDTCDVSYGHVFAEGPDDGAITSSASLEETVATRAVISGTVTATALGIHNAIPFTILQIDEDGEAGRAPRVYLMFPRGRLQFEGITFCNDDPTFTDMPTVGDPIVFIASYPLDAAGTLYSTSLIVYEHASVVMSSDNFQLQGEARPQSVRAFAERLRRDKAHAKVVSTPDVTP